MKSLDTNILLYSINTDCSEHAICRQLVDKALSEKDSWIVADQVWFELYRLLRNSVVLQKPLTASQAAKTIDWYREKSGWLKCAWEPDMMKDLKSQWEKQLFGSRKSFDAVLAVTLKGHGVREFYTRNNKDFDDFGFFTVTNPLINPSYQS
ncbi:MAG: PIN domain-containing protein [Spirochaetaceae bacterium]|nr:PIN domain-containing protein [Spirochaetaceae bacterium]